jgi:hypothetical protein
MQSHQSQLFDALANDTRRHVLFALLDEPEWLPVGPDSALCREREQDSTYVRLRHVHLPKLCQWGYITWNREADEVTRGPAFDEIQLALTALRDRQDEPDASRAK